MKLNDNYPKMAQPADPYDTEAWMDFYAANPGFRRGVGAEGVNDDPDAEAEAAKKAEEEAAAKKTEEVDDDPKDKKPSDAEAALLKDVMKNKEARKAAEKRAAELEAQLGDIDIDEYKALKAEREEAAEAKKKAEEEAAIAAGDFEKVRAQMTEQYEGQIETLKTELGGELETTKAELAKARATIEDLTVGSQFNTSKLITDETVYTPSKARRLYGDHFEVEDGKVVAYDKPRGAEDRTRLVDAKGNPADFETAMRRIIEADPEKDDIFLASIKPGASSEPGAKTAKKETAPATSRDKIMSGMSDLLKTIETPSDGGVKL